MLLPFPGDRFAENPGVIFKYIRFSVIFLHGGPALSIYSSRETIAILCPRRVSAAAFTPLQKNWPAYIPALYLVIFFPSD